MCGAEGLSVCGFQMVLELPVSKKGKRKRLHVGWALALLCVVVA